MLRIQRIRILSTGKMSIEKMCKQQNEDRRKQKLTEEKENSNFTYFAVSPTRLTRNLYIQYINY